jgi:rhamnosyltransferase
MGCTGNSLLPNRNMKPEFSIIVPTRNSVGIIDKLIASLSQQDFSHSYEIIFLVTESTDGTVDFLKQSPLNHKRIIPVAKTEFSHSQTRMKGAELAQGQTIIFLTEDIIPLGADFLTRLTAPLLNHSVEAVYGVYQTDPDRADPVQAFLDNDWYEKVPDTVGPISEQEWQQMSPSDRRAACNFDDCASCIDRNTLLELRFPDVPYGEDMFFAKRLLTSGRRIAMAKNARFYHWHRMSFAYTLKRMCLDQHLSLREFGIVYVKNKLDLIWKIGSRLLYRFAVCFFVIPISFRKKLVWFGYQVKTVTADFLGKYVGKLNEKENIKIFNPVNRRLFHLKLTILQEVAQKSIGRY